MPTTTTTTTRISRTTLPHPALRKTALLSLLPALPLCITHGALSEDLFPALGLVPLFFSALVSTFLLVRARRLEKGKQADAERIEAEGLLDSEADDDGGNGDGADGCEEHERGESVLTHRIVVFVLDAGLAAALMVVLVFTWLEIGSGRMGEGERPELVMLASYATIPLLDNFLIHLYLAARELVAGLAMPELAQFTAWRAVPPDCPNCGSRLRPDSLPPIPWYESVSAPKVSLPRISAPSIPRPSVPAFQFPRFSAFRSSREWKVPNWMKGRTNQDASLFVDAQDEHDRYTDDPEGPFGGPSGTTTVVATGAADPVPVVEEVVVGKKDKRGKSGSGPELFGEDDASWP